MHANCTVRFGEKIESSTLVRRVGNGDYCPNIPELTINLLRSTSLFYKVN